MSEFDEKIKYFKDGVEEIKRLSAELRFKDGKLTEEFKLWIKGLGLPENPNQVELLEAGNKQQ
jgi:hypothetical protein